MSQLDVTVELTVVVQLDEIFEEITLPAPGFSEPSHDGRGREMALFAENRTFFRVKLP